MNIVALRPFDIHELTKKLKNLTMLHDTTQQPYLYANIQVTEIAPNLLSPAQLYVQRSEFEKVRDLRWVLQDKYHIDILRLADCRVVNQMLTDQDNRDGQRVGYVEIDVVPTGSSGGDSQEPQTITILPPVIEVWGEADGTKHNIINDGMHRCYLARICHIIPSVVRIDVMPKGLPYYAYPAPNGWADVKLVDKLGPDLIKKHHRFPPGVYQKYYRNFNSVFTNVGGPRGSTAK